MEKLKEYEEKRTWNTTPEPKAGRGPEGAGSHLVFVVHKHAASRLHYDLRLEMDGVLKSFAIPKGPSLDPSVKRLAVLVEDHPFEYKDFEGVIPKGNYGAGNVIIWDSGFYSHPSASNREESEKALLEGLKKGDLKFALAGKKLKGEFALVKARWDDKSWLLIKKKDSYISTKDILEEDRSVISNRTVEEVSGGQPQPSSTGKKTRPIREGAASSAKILKNAPVGAMPRNVNPMLSFTAEKPFDHPEWIFEIKWDGYRAIAEIGNQTLSLYSRNHKSFINVYPAIADGLQKLKITAILDGEIVALNRAGLPDFQLLQDYAKTPRGRLIYYVFDILYYHGHDLTGLPLSERKDLLKSILPLTGPIKFADHVWNDGVSFFQAVKEKGLEGIMAKYSKSTYREGIRSKNWLKIKNRLVQDCVIAGFTQPRGTRKYFGSLVLGAFEKGRFVYVGHSGGGFAGKDLKKIYERLLPLVRQNCPFETKPPEDMPITWVEPVIVCEFAFTEWTKDNILRHPVFLRFREDKTAAEAVRESLSDLQTPQM